MIKNIRFEKFKNIPATVKFKQIHEIDRMEERFFDIEQHFGDIVGMNDKSVCFCPNNNPPLKDEILPWLWIIHSEEKEEILKYANVTLSQIIQDYEQDL